MAHGAWQPPWPPIRVGVDEWVIMRNSIREPAAVVKTVQLGPRGRSFFRVVTWAQTSAGRELVGYFETLDDADRSVLFDQPTPDPPGAPVGERGGAYPQFPSARHPAPGDRSAG